jgi:hypothetical protein
MKSNRSFALTGLAMAFLLLFAQQAAFAQATPKKKKTIETKASTTPIDVVTKLKKPGNDKEPKPESKSRGDVYGPNYSDIIVDNYTGYAIDIYVDGDYRGTVGAYDKRVTWAVPGNTRLYAKAEFNDGTYIYWGPTVTYTGYEYTWKLTR